MFWLRAPGCVLERCFPKCENVAESPRVAVAVRPNRSLAFRHPEGTLGAAATTDTAAVTAEAEAAKGVVGLEDLSLAMEKVLSHERFRI